MTYIIPLPILSDRLVPFGLPSAASYEVSLKPSDVNSFFTWLQWNLTVPFVNTSIVFRLHAYYHIIFGRLQSFPHILDHL